LSYKKNPYNVQARPDVKVLKPNPTRKVLQKKSSIHPWFYYFESPARLGLKNFTKKAQPGPAWKFFRKRKSDLALIIFFKVQSGPVSVRAGLFEHRDRPCGSLIPTYTRILLYYCYYCYIVIIIVVAGSLATN
jgi:hypothetical protein